VREVSPPGAGRDQGPDCGCPSLCPAESAALSHIRGSAVTPANALISRMPLGVPPRHPRPHRSVLGATAAGAAKQSLGSEAVRRPTPKEPRSSAAPEEPSRGPTRSLQRGPEEEELPLGSSQLGGTT